MKIKPKVNYRKKKISGEEEVGSWSFLIGYRLSILILKIGV